jgi:hypothetical protein
VKERFHIQHKIKQDPLPEGLNVPHKPPMSARLPIANAAHHIDVIQEDTRPFATDPTLPIDADIVDPDLTPEFVDPVEIDTAQFNYPWSPTVNYANGLQHPSVTEVDFTFGYLSLQE